jgi:LDH2 family malate/lactate/ureidoglycolate dehydrogenase
VTESTVDRAITVRIGDLHACIRAAFERLDLPNEHAAGIADLLVDAELRGHPDHGAAMLSFLADLYRDGTYNRRPQVRVISETDGALLLDGDRGCGSVAPRRAMEWCIARARERKGMAVAGVRNWQMNVGGPYVRLAAEAGLIGYAATNATPMVAPPGGLTRVLGTNPCAYGLPAGRYGTVVMDLATSNSAALKVRVANLQGREVPPNIVLDRTGQPSTHPNDFYEGGTMASLGYPLAAHKGFGLALAIDALAGILTGSGFAGGVGGPDGTSGNLFWALDVEAFLPGDQFAARIESQLDQIKRSQRTDGVDELLLPGERGQRRHAELTARGTVPLAPASWDSLVQTCTELGAPVPTPVTS